MIRTLLTSVAALGLAAAPAYADTFVIRGETVWTGTAQGMIENGVVVIEDDRIVTVGGADTEVPGGATEISAEWVTPGLIASFARTGLVEVGAEDSTNDTAAAMSPFSAALNAADGFNPDATAIDVTRIEGFTRLVVVPNTGNALFAGQGFVADTSGDLDTELDEKAFTFIKLGEAGAGLAGGSRQSAMTLLRAALDDARSYPARYITQNDGAVLNRIDAQALSPAARGQQLILIEASRASDLNAVMDLAEEEPSLKIVIVGADEAWRVAPRLAEMDIPVIKVRKILKIAQEPISLETPIGEEEDSHLGDFIEDQGVVSPAEAVININLKDQTATVLQTLTDREEQVIRMRFGIGDGSEHTLEEVGQRFSVTRERIRQIEVRAFEKLQKRMRDLAREKGMIGTA